ncbi:hypothetical protein TNCV_1218741 [Trichonephila clavipes]|nr:hypothetical protein TNCV_1218741 [Trichonephila clavipes]
MRLGGGGLWERLVGIIKQCLRKTLGRAFLDEKNFSTVFVGVEAPINSRPLVAENLSLQGALNLHFATGRISSLVCSVCTHHHLSHLLSSDSKFGTLQSASHMTDKGQSGLNPSCPPRSPDLLQELHQSISDETGAIPAVQLRPAFRNLMTRAQSHQEMNGGHFQLLQAQWPRGSISRFHITGSGFYPRSRQGQLSLSSLQWVDK